MKHLAKIIHTLQLVLALVVGTCVASQPHWKPHDPFLVVLCYTSATMWLATWPGLGIY